MRSTAPRSRRFAADVRNDVRARLRNLPGNVLAGAAFITWGLDPALHGIETITRLLTGAW